VKNGAGKGEFWHALFAESDIELHQAPAFQFVESNGGNEAEPDHCRKSRKGSQVAAAMAGRGA
jgi:hypothetical protein